MDIATFKACVKAIAEMPAFTEKKFRKPAIMVRGRHGLGKTDVIHEIGEELGMEVLDERLGQMTEGDMKGLPYKDGGVTRFAPAHFIKRAQEKPVILFFDEGNRAVREVLQGVFQIVQDGEFDGHVLHPDTLVFFAINDGAEYQVTKMDPALKDRFLIVDLKPTFEDWVKWARGKKGQLTEDVIAFLESVIKTHPEFFELEKEPSDPREVTPSRRSWEKFARVAKPFIEADVDLNRTGEDKEAANVHTMIMALGSGFIGTTVTTAFLGFLKTRVTLSSEDVLDNWEDVGSKKLNRLGSMRWHKVKDAILSYALKEKLTDKQARNIGKAILGMPADLQLGMWMSISNDAGVENPITVHNIRIIHPYCGQTFLKAINGQANTAGALP